MELNPQFNYDKNGNLLGVFLSTEDWMSILPKLEVDISREEKDMIDERLAAYRANPSAGMDAEEFFRMLDAEDEAA